MNLIIVNFQEAADNYQGREIFCNFSAEISGLCAQKKAFDLGR
jgi:hypothetical protein